MSREPRVPHQYISLADSARMLAVSEGTVHNMLRDGRLRAYRLGRTIRLRVDEIEAAMVPFGGAA